MISARWNQGRGGGFSNVTGCQTLQESFHSRWHALARHRDWNDPFSLLVAGYYDLNAKDGSLPNIPVLDPNRGQFHGLDFNQLFGDVGFGGAFEPRALEQPTPVPEPATLAMMAAGLTALAARRRRVTSRR